MMRFVLTLTFMSFCIAMPQIAKAQNKYFPYKINEDGEVIAPFGDPDVNKKSADPLMGLFDPMGGTLENSSSIDTPHRSEGQLAKWAAETIVEATSFDTNTAAQTLETIRPLFTRSGWNLYKQFLRSEEIAQNLKTPGYKTASYNLQDAELLAKGVAEGVFKWVYDMPLSLQKGNAVENINITVQITRVPKSEDSAHDVKIESWKVERLQPKEAPNKDNNRRRR